MHGYLVVGPVPKQELMHIIITFIMPQKQTIMKAQWHYKANITKTTFCTP